MHLFNSSLLSALPSANSWDFLGFCVYVYLCHIQHSHYCLFIFHSASVYFLLYKAFEFYYIQLFISLKKQRTYN